MDVRVRFCCCCCSCALLASTFTSTYRLIKFSYSDNMLYVHYILFLTRSAPRLTLFLSQPGHCVWADSLLLGSWLLALRACQKARASGVSSFARLLLAHAACVKAAGCELGATIAFVSSAHKLQTPRARAQNKGLAWERKRANAISWRAGGAHDGRVQKHLLCAISARFSPINS